MKRALTFVVFTSLLMLSQAAFASTLILFNEERRAGANGSGTFYGGEGPWSFSHTGTNASGTASVAHDTTLSASFLGGSGLAAAQHVQGTAHVGAGTQLFVDLAIEGQSYMADLSVLLSATGGNAYAVVELQRTDGGFSDLVREFFRNETRQVTYSATLLPGTYRFSLDAQAGVSPLVGVTSGRSSFDGGLTLTPIGPTPVPEPASMLLLGSGLAAIAARKYRQSKARHES